MTDQMYAYLCKVEAVANDVGMFDIEAVSSEEEIELIKQARAYGWIHIRSGDHFITRSGFAALQSEKQEREEEAKREAKEAAKQAQADARADQQLHKQFKHDWRVAIFNVLSAFVLGLVAQYLFDIVGVATRAWNSLFH